ncbi:zf-HC2 domain-containing protein [Sporomusa sp. KB1]|jgi:predicted anti-sigma-YlaC factor YlaD|uniref:anti-sigma factor n=1 Tax=Sporomusa sp. KB1 TaxID=943346 RepID=UPI0011A26F7B|nr:zf-HC2 domain-containing protein [Sporomusa sp. KB1]TWH46277.1 putative zinc finger protein [Sporomusa sp. KB1]
MKCSECEDLIYDYLDNELDFNTAEQIKAHFSKCSSCNSKYLDIQQALSVFKTDLTTVKVSDDFSQKVILEIEKQEASNFLSYAIVGILGSIAAGLTVSIVLLYPVLQIVMKYTVQFFTLWYGVVSVLPFNNILLIVFSIVLLFIAMAMRSVITMEEGQV